ncbi:hypothetical protein [Helicobacter bizzozeronii]|uniref:hypothetical protein n=1 Tax=Helicobacter bizzozeronii TaxID=56877 RepID=UPI000CEE55A4|nr:hypothetical protein [Helicobacter bizzozeronii]
MRKAKFLLRCDGIGVRDLEELGAHFDVLDVLQHYQDHTLDRWLDSRGYERELMLVREINATEPLEIAYALCGIFGVEADKESLQAILRQQEHIAQKHEELKLYQDQQQALKEIILKCAPPALPLFKDYIKAYADLKEQFFSATHLEDARTILRQLRQDYAELLEMDKRGIVDVLSARAGISVLAFLLWLCAGVSLWNRWDMLRQLLYHGNKNIFFRSFKGFAELKTLTIPRNGKVHAFEKAAVVCVSMDGISSGGRNDYTIKLYDIQANQAISSKDGQYLFPFKGKDAGGDFCLLKGAVKIDYRNERPSQDTTLTYIEIEP